MNLLDLLRKIFGRSPKVQPLSPDQIRRSKVMFIEETFGPINRIPDNNRIDAVIKDIESGNIDQQHRALRILGLSESIRFTSDFAIALKNIK